MVHLLDAAQVLRKGRTGAQRRAAAHALVATLAEHRIALVQTVLPVAGYALDRRDESHRILDRATTVFITLDETTVTPDPGRTTVIPHVHYRDRFLGFPVTTQVPGRLLCLSRTGLSRAAAGPLKVFSVMDTPGVSLRVVGDADPDLDELIPRAVRRNPDSVSAAVEHLSDAELVRELSAAELVMLPGINTFADLTALFMALSLDRPVVVPRSTTASLLADQVGPGWVTCLPGPVTAELLDATIRTVREQVRTPRPDLDGRDPETVAEQYATVFHRAAERVRTDGQAVLAGEDTLPDTLLGHLLGHQETPSRHPGSLPSGAWTFLSSDRDSSA
ncbi:hypothetical protein GCM10011575_08450 [Microlunatus endophyticus]|uniref:Uncharacterized protein n=1 Tax=Microlunatus endophyticus TaxID=1716077 RepID=A0A917S3K2_9ACTN|nr:hypothetical protein GCM10011575_08450 [Microlunatus endophyticus]